MNTPQAVKAPLDGHHRSPPIYILFMRVFQLEMAGQNRILYETELSFQLKESHCTGECHQQAFGKLVVEGCSCWRDAPSPDLPEAINCLTIASPPLQMSLVSTSSTILPQVFNNIFLEYQKQAIDAAMQSSDTVVELLSSATNCFTITPCCATSSFTPPSLHPDVTLSTGSQCIFFVLGCIDLEDNSASFGRYSGHILHRFLFTFCKSFLHWPWSVATIRNTSLLP